MYVVECYNDAVGGISCCCTFQIRHGFFHFLGNFLDGQFVFDKGMSSFTSFF